MEKQFTIISESELPKLAGELINGYESIRVFVFHGNLGAGKTTFIKQICAVLGVEGAMSSPSFSIVNEYQTNKGEPVYHVDCYRMKDESEAWDIGLDEILDSGAYCFIEWPDKIDNLLPENYVRVSITQEENQRIFKFSKEI